MKTYPFLLFAVAGLIICLSAPAQSFKQDGKMARLRKAYAALKHPEITFETFLSIEKERDKMRMNALNKQNLPSVANAVPRGDVCYNGDFEFGLLQSEWGGAYGVLSGTTIDFNLLTYGLQGGILSNQNARQTLVSAGIDPNVGINNVAPGGSTNAVRIGNSMGGSGVELLSKNFTVTNSNALINFWFAVVMFDPGSTHTISEKPYFRVRVVDNGTNNEILGSVNIGNGGDKVYADLANPFFQVSGGFVYRDWNCAQINLSNYIGKSVTIQFITADCAQGGGHPCYAFIDNFCGSCANSPAGNIAYDTTSVKCGSNSICVKYGLPKAGSQTGTVKLALKMYQNGNLLTTLNSPTLGSDSSYCFNITPSAIPGINTALGGFDFAITADFAIGSSPLSTQTLGTILTGQKAGQNNDYRIACPVPGTVSYTDTVRCGSGQICTGYTLPSAGSITGTMALKIKFYQGGILLDSMSSGILSSGNSYCFNINPNSIRGINTSLKGFDFTITGTSAIFGTDLGTVVSGKAGTGQVSGTNNDYNISCLTQATIKYNDTITYKCGTGNICFNYTLPFAGSDTGTAVIKLYIYQGGVLKDSLASPTLTSGSSYCFNINPLSLSNLNSSLPGFDLVGVIIGTYNNVTLPATASGMAPNGQLNGINNDYSFYCPRPGSITFADSASTNCGSGIICYNYTLPASGFITGSVVLSLRIYQTGNILTTINSPVLTTGNKYCFNINPATIPGINNSLGGFDFDVTGTFGIAVTGATLPPITAGTFPNGTIDGVNNDYMILCPTPASLTYNQRISSLCGIGQVCFNYSLPAVGSNAGTGQLTLHIFQNGVLLKSLVSPVLTSGNSYCFSINPSSIPNLDVLSTNGIDFLASGSFSFTGAATSTIVVGDSTSGLIEGTNNDYAIACPQKGNISFLPAQSSSCGRGSLCFKYTLPRAGSDTGTMVLTMRIYQNGSLLTALTSATISSDSVFCFSLNPSALSNIDLTLLGIDYTLQAEYSVGGNIIGSDSIGTLPGGQIAGANNDYLTFCPQAATISFSDSVQCGKGLICFNYTLPKAGLQNGTAIIMLNVYQNGAKVKTLSSGVLGSGNKYCFTSGITGLDNSLPGFDFNAVISSSIGGINLDQSMVGDSINGMFGDQNNDFLFACIKTGSIAYNDSATTDCGPGNICFDYTLPKSGSTVGKVKIDLKIYQSGRLLTTVSSPDLTTGSQYCFAINPATIPGIVTSNAAFDFVATASFAVGSNVLAPISAGSDSAGQKPGLNNDYAIYCSKQCCPGTNLVANGGFELGNTAFTSAYTYEPTIAQGSVVPGRFGIMTSAQAQMVSANWNPDCAANNRSLVVNGATGRTLARTVWSQTVTLPRGKTFTFCADFKNLPHCAFDVLPKVSIRFSTVPTANILNQTINVSNAGCGWQTLSKTFSVTGTGSLTTVITISLDETGNGDGNDLAMDNISLVALNKVPVSELQFSLNLSNVTASSFNVAATPVSTTLANCKASWQLEQLSATFTPVSGTKVTDPASWLPLNPNTFPGYNGTSSLAGSNPGVFDAGKRYRIIFGRTCDCTEKGIYAVIMDPLVATRAGRKMNIYEDVEYMKSVNGYQQPGPVFRKTIQINNSPKKSVKAEVELPEIYPNPATDMVNISMPVNTKARVVKLYNAKYQLLQTAPVAYGQKLMRLPVSRYPVGVYLLQVFADNGQLIVTKKIVKE